MDEIVKQVAARAGIPEESARMAVEVVFQQLEKRLPAPISSQIRKHLGGEASGGEVGGLEKGLGGLFGR